MSDIIERLRAVSGFVQAEWGRTAAAAAISTEAADEIARLRALTEWQREHLERIEWWGQAYPTSVFRVPDYGKAHEVLMANGMTLDAISADVTRHAIEQAVAIAKAGLTPPDDA